MSDSNLNATLDLPHIDDHIPWAVAIESATKGEIKLLGLEVTTDKLEFSSSIYQIFAYGEWIHKNDPLLVEQGDISIGTILQFTFAPSNSPAITIQMRVTGIEINSYLTAKYVGNGFRLTMTNNWYFSQFSISHAYQGRISDIIKQTIEGDDIQDAFFNIGSSGSYSTNIIDSGDDPLAIRYRTEMTPSNFFTSRLKPHFLSPTNSSIYLYTNLSNQLEFLDYPAMVNQTGFTAIEWSHPHMTAFASIVSNYNTADRIIFPYNHQISINATEEKPLWALANPALLYMYHFNGITKLATDFPVLQFLGYNTSNRFTFIDKDVVPTLTTKTYMDDSFHDYEDIFSEVLNEYYKALADNQMMNMVCYPNLSVDVGRICNRYLTYNDDTTPSLFSQNYMITGVSHVFQGYKGASYITLATTAFTFNNASDVAPLWSVE
jgi:hypothetical protein